MFRFLFFKENFEPPQENNFWVGACYVIKYNKSLMPKWSNSEVKNGCQLTEGLVSSRGVKRAVSLASYEIQVSDGEARSPGSNRVSIWTPNHSTNDCRRGAESSLLAPPSGPSIGYTGIPSWSSLMLAPWLLTYGLQLILDNPNNNFANKTKHKN